MRRVCLNRTFMELKLGTALSAGSSALFESHLYGIETNIGSWLRVATTLFESHLYGIET